MRFSRFKKKHDTSLLNSTTTNGESGTPAAEDAPVSEGKAKPLKKAPGKTGGAKKRKLNEDDSAKTVKIKAEEMEDVLFPLCSIPDPMLTILPDLA